MQKPIAEKQNKVPRKRRRSRKKRPRKPGGGRGTRMTKDVFSEVSRTRQTEGNKCHDWQRQAILCKTHVGPGWCLLALKEGIRVLVGTSSQVSPTLWVFGKEPRMAPQVRNAFPPNCQSQHHTGRRNKREVDSHVDPTRG